MQPGGYDSLCKAEVILIVDILALDAVRSDDTRVEPNAAVVFTPHIGTKDKECRRLNEQRLQILGAWHVRELIVKRLTLPPRKSLYLLGSES